MKMTRTRALTAIALLAALVLAGCFETTLNLGKVDGAKVDPALCGVWDFSWTDGEKKVSAEVTVLNFDDKQYYVQWTQAGEKPAHLRAFLIRIKDATFAQATELGSDLKDKHVIVRVEMKGSKLMIRHLEPQFFNGLTSDAQLRSKVEENLNNDAMYSGPWLAGSQVEKP